jgi:hypothetical protein
LFQQGFLGTASTFEKFSEVPEESHGIPAEEAIGHHRWEGNHTL